MLEIIKWITNDFIYETEFYFMAKKRRKGEHSDGIRD